MAFAREVSSTRILSQEDFKRIRAAQRNKHVSLTLSTRQRPADEVDSSEASEDESEQLVAHPKQPYVFLGLFTAI